MPDDPRDSGAEGRFPAYGAEEPPDGITGEGTEEFFPEPPPRRAGAGAAVLTYVAVLMLVLAGSLFLGSVGGEVARWPLLVQHLAFILLPALVAVRLTGGSAVRDLRLRPLRPGLLILSPAVTLFSLPVLVVLLAGLRVLFPGGEQLERFLSESLRAEGPLELLYVLLVAAVTPAVCEEALFRGWILTALGRSFSPTRALLFQAVLFGTLHFHPLRILPTALLGLLLGWFTLRTGSLLAPILGHAAFNGAVVLLAQLGDTVEEETTSYPGLETAVWAAGGLVLLVGGCILFGWLSRRRGLSGPVD